MAHNHFVGKRSILSPFHDLALKWHMEPFFLLLVGTLVAFLLFCLIVLGNGKRATIAYTSDDVVYASPIQAVHESSSRRNSILPLKTGDSANSVPEILVSELFYDFGAVKTPQVVNRVFIIANRGQTPLSIQSAYTTCGCTTADLTSADIPPGKVALMTVHFDTGVHDLRGTTVRRGVILQTNDPAHPQVEIWVQATVN
jgi:hypothetical protein